MRTIKQLLKVKDKSHLSPDEYILLQNWIIKEAKITLPPEQYSSLLGWWILGDDTIQLSPQEAGNQY